MPTPVPASAARTPAVVEGAGDVARQADLALARLVAGDQARELAALLEDARYLVLVEPRIGLAPRGLGDDVHAIDRVVHDVRSYARGAGLGGDAHVGLARPQRARGVVVDDDVAALEVGREGGHRGPVAPGDDEHLADAAVLDDAAGGEDLAARVRGDLLAEALRRLGSEALRCIHRLRL